MHADEASGPLIYLQKRWLWLAVNLAAAIPLLWLLWNYSRGQLGVDPVNTINNLTGRSAMILLLASLACTPLNTIFGFRKVLTVRKSLGLWAFAYAGLHLLNYVGLDYGFDFRLIQQDAVLDKPYILVGAAALTILLALAITSTRGWMKRLGRTWKRLHRFAYVAGVFVILHFFWQAKAAERVEPLIYGLVLALLLIVRIPSVRRRIVSIRTALAPSRDGEIQPKQTPRQPQVVEATVQSAERKLRFE